MSQVKYFNVKHNIDEFQRLSNKLVIGNGDYPSYSDFLPSYNFFLCNPQTEDERNNLLRNCSTCGINVIFCVVDLNDQEQVNNFVETFIDFFEYIYLDSNCPISLNIDNINLIMKSNGIYEVSKSGFLHFFKDRDLSSLNRTLSVMIENDDYSGIYTKDTLKMLCDRYFLYGRVIFIGSDLVLLKKVCEQLIVILLSIEMESTTSRISYGEPLIQIFERINIFDLNDPKNDFKILMDIFIFTIGSTLFTYNPQILAFQLIEDNLSLNKYFIKE